MTLCFHPQFSVTHVDPVIFYNLWGKHKGWVLWGNNNFWSEKKFKRGFFCIIAIEAILIDFYTCRMAVWEIPLQFYLNVIRLAPINCISSISKVQALATAHMAQTVFFLKGDIRTRITILKLWLQMQMRFLKCDMSKTLNTLRLLTGC